MKFSSEQLIRQKKIKAELGLMIADVGLFAVAFFTKNYPAMVLTGIGSGAAIVDMIRHLWKGAFDAGRFTSSTSDGPKPKSRDITVIIDDKTGTLDNIRGPGGGDLRNHENDPSNQ
jgi:hypothetical protein